MAGDPRRRRAVRDAGDADPRARFRPRFAARDGALRRGQALALTSRSPIPDAVRVGGRPAVPPAALRDERADLRDRLGRGHLRRVRGPALPQSRRRERALPTVRPPGGYPPPGGRWLALAVTPHPGGRVRAPHAEPGGLPVTPIGEAGATPESVVLTIANEFAQ